MQPVFERIFRTSSEPVLVVDGEGVISDFNDAVTALTALAPGNLAGRALTDVFQDNGYDEETGQLVLGLIQPDRQERLFLCDEPGEAAQDDGYRILRLSAVEENGDALLRKLNAALVEHSSSAMFAKSPDGRYHVGNEAWKKLSGLSVELVGETDYDIFSKEIADRFRASDHLVMETGQQQALLTPSDDIYETIPGEDRWFFVEKFLVRDDDGTILGIAGVSTDVTPIQRANENLEAANESLRKFSYIASHDLQEPLRKINTFGELLSEDHGDKLGEDGRHLVNVIRTAARRMSDLVRDLLQYSRARNKPLEPVRIPLESVLNGLLQDYDMSIRETGADIQLDPLPVVKADPTQMTMLFGNLLSNALKYRREDVQPVIRVRAQKGKSGSFSVTVEDNGIGFDMTYAEKIFDPFQRLHGADEYSGSGIGLSLCKAAIERHNWQIVTKSVPDQGTDFSILIPAADVADDQEQRGSAD